MRVWELGEVVACHIPGSRGTVRVGDRASSTLTDLSGHKLSRWVTQMPSEAEFQARLGDWPGTCSQIPSEEIKQATV